MYVTDCIDLQNERVGNLLQCPGGWYYENDFMSDAVSDIVYA